MHIAAAEGNLTMTRVLFEAGANLRARDRWGHTPLDEARRVHAGPVIAFLEGQLAEGVGKSVNPWE